MSEFGTSIDGRGDLRARNGGWPAWTMAVALAGLFALAGDAAGQAVPKVTSVTLEAPDRPAGSVGYGLGERIRVRVAFSERVSASGSYVALEIGARTRRAYRVRGSSLVDYEYPIQAADMDVDGVSVPANAISGTPIRSAADRNVFADVSHGAVADPFNKVDGSVAVAPKITGIRFGWPYGVDADGAPVRQRAYALGSVIGPAVWFDKPVRVTGQPKLALVVGEATRQASFTGLCCGSAPTRMSFRYVVQAWDADSDGVSVPANGLTLNGGTIALQDAPGTAADLRHEAASARLEDRVDGRLVTPPRVWISGTIAPIHERTYGRGEAIEIFLWLDRWVRVGGEPELAVLVGAKTRRASFVELIENSRFLGYIVGFNYVVQADDAGGIALAENPLVFANGAVTLAGDAGIALELTAEDADRLSERWASYQVDGGVVSTPGIGSIWPYGRPAGGGRYGLGETIRASACFDSAVAVSGEPRLRLDLGGQIRQAVPGALLEAGCNYFRHVVQAGDLDLDGFDIPADALSVEGGSFTLLGDSGVAADLSHDPVSQADSRWDRMVDGTAVDAPRVTGISFVGGPSSGGWYGAGETIGVRVSFDKEVAVEGEPRLELNVGGGIRHASLRETGAIVDSPRRAEDGRWLTFEDEHFAAFFDYVVQPGDLDTDGIGVPANALSLDGGSMTFAAAPDVAADLSHAALDRDPARPVDGRPAAGFADCDPWSDPGPAGVHSFAHGYAVSACVEHPDGGEIVHRRASDFGLAAGESALFWFFDRDNAEILVKVLDACAVNGHRWVFLGPVTDLAFNLEVLELSTGKRWRYRNPAGRTAATRSDTAAFPCDAAAASRAGTGPSPAPGDAGPLGGSLSPVRGRVAETGTETDCEPGGASLTLKGGYKVGMCYETPQGRTGDALDFRLDSSQSGLLYFFDPDNAEVLIKVLDGCSLNGHRWVYVAPVTDLAFNLHIDGPDGKRWTHRNRQGQTASTASDLSFFPCASASGASAR